MKKIIFLLFVSLFIFGPASFSALAEDPPQPDNTERLRNIPLVVPIPTPGGTFSQTTNEPIDYLRAIYFWLIGFGALAAVFMIVFAGVQYVASVGVPALRGQATERIRSAIIGLIMLLGAVAILSTFNDDILTNTSINSYVQQIDNERIEAARRREEEAKKYPLSRKVEQTFRSIETVSKSTEENAHRGNPQSSPSYEALKNAFITSTEDIFNVFGAEEGNYEEDNQIMAAHLRALDQRITAEGNHPVVRAAFEAALQHEFSQHNYSDSNDSNLRDVYYNGGNEALEPSQVNIIRENMLDYGYLVPWLLADDDYLDFNLPYGNSPIAVVSAEDVLRAEYEQAINTVRNR